MPVARAGSAPRRAPTPAADAALGRRTMVGGLGLALGLPWLAGCGSSPAGQPLSAEASLLAAVNGPQRTPAFRARDAARHPVATLQFFGLQPQHQVLELAPGGGWYTEILAPWLRAQGHLYAAHYAANDAEPGRRRARAGFEAKLARAPAVYDRVSVGTLPTADHFTDLQVPGGADRVLTFRNVHNWLEQDRLDGMLRAVFALLKPGGMLGVVDHRAAEGTPLAEMQRSGYVTEALMAAHAHAAGFVLDGRSELNANPLDTRDHPNGVWSLPPSLRGGTQDQARFLAIGESDRFTHRYLKPLA